MANFCTQCGGPLVEGASFCPACGAPVSADPEPVSESPAEESNLIELPNGIVTNGAGTYMWTYEQNMWQHTELLGTIFKIFGGIFAALFLFTVLVLRDDFLTNLLVFGGIFAVIAVISVIAWAIVCALHHGRQHLIFTMTETSITYDTLPESAKVAEGISTVGLVVGAATGNYALMGSSIAAGSGAFTNEYRTVKKIKAVPRRDLIRVHSTFEKNAIYCSPAQYEFVWEHLTSHCPGAKIVR